MERKGDVLGRKGAFVFYSLAIKRMQRMHLIDNDKKIWKDMFLEREREICC